MRSKSSRDKEVCSGWWVLTFAEFSVRSCSHTDVAQLWCCVSQYNGGGGGGNNDVAGHWLAT